MKTRSRQFGMMSASILVLSLGARQNNSTSSNMPIEPIIDSLPPVITFSASDASPQGGETIVLSATVEDNVDPDLVASIECDGGLLRSEFLTTPNTNEAFTIQCSASSEDSSGNMTSENLIVEVVPTVRRLKMLQSGDVFQPGSAVTFSVENLGVTDEQIAASLDDLDVTLFNTNDGIMSFVVPFDALASESVFSFQIEEDSYSFDIPIENGEVIQHPSAFISDFGAVVVSQLDDLATNLNNNLSDADREDVNGGVKVGQ